MKMVKNNGLIHLVDLMMIELGLFNKQLTEVLSLQAILDSGDNDLDIYLVKTNEDGEEQWFAQTFGGEYNDSGYSMQQTIDGGYIVTITDRLVWRW